MLPKRSKNNDDYDLRVKALTGWNVLQYPKLAGGVPFAILDRHMLTEYSYMCFVAWLILGHQNSASQRVRLAIVPSADGNRSLLCLSPVDTPLAAAGRMVPGGVALDEHYFRCPLDKAVEGGSPSISMSTQRLCPVVNRIRYNLGESDVDCQELIAPKKTKDCCDSKKAALWEYLAETIEVDPTTYGALVGGTAFPIEIPFDRLRKVLTGIRSETQDFGMLFEETLLWFALEASGVSMGLPHVEFLKPHLFYEIDFVLYETAGKNKELSPEDEPSEGWPDYVKDQSLCVFEVTLGHEPEASDSTSEENHFPVNEQPVGGRRTRPGNDHPRNKLLNYHALRAAGFKRVDYHYLSMKPPKGQQLNDVTGALLKQTDGFHYWSLDKNPNGPVCQASVSHLEAPIPPDTARGWHEEVVEHVVEAAEDFRRTLA